MRTEPKAPVMILLATLMLSSAQADDWHFSDVERVVAVGDIHGAYDALIETLQHSDIIDSSLTWSGGMTHFVLTGDSLDRGPDSRRVMNFVMRLEQEAAHAGGRVHQLLGNHEVMNLIGDLRYVTDTEYAAFLDIESVEEREFWYQRFRRSRPADMDEAAVRMEFDEKAPPGYFGHRRAFRRDGIYGEWLLKKPLMVVINDTAFVHGGLPPYVGKKGLKGVNGALKRDLSDYVETRALLGDAGVLSPIDRFKEVPPILIHKSTIGHLKGVVSSAQKVIDLSDTPLHGSEGPTWYRGTASCSGLIEGDVLNVALSKVGAKRVVIGHTTTVTRQVQQRMSGRVVEIDTGMLKASYQGSGNALIIEGGDISVVNQDGETGRPITHPVRVGHESMAIDDDSLAEILRNGKIARVKTDGAAWRLVQVNANEQTVFAYFREQPRDQNSVPELAAYKLDRMLGLGMVPVTVRREIAGHQGTLQFVPPEIMTERERVADGKGKKMPCSLDKQKGAMYVFDALIHNPTRTPSNMLYSPDDWLLVLVDHENSFGTTEGRPAYLTDVELAIGDQWRTALLELDNEVLRAELGSVLDEHSLAALGKRRDALVHESLSN